MSFRLKKNIEKTQKANVTMHLQLKKTTVTYKLYI